MQNVQILKSVGSKGVNKPIDVALVQSLLVKYFSDSKNISNKEEIKAKQKAYSTLIVNGRPTEHLNAAIKLFQQVALSIEKPDGKVDPRGKTIKKLLQTFAIKPRNIKKEIFGASTFQVGLHSNIPTARFKNYFKKYYGLTTSKGEDLNGFFEKIKSDSEVTNICWIAYMIATVYHETTFSFKPKKEDGQGKGYRYAKKIEVVDPKGIRGKVGLKYKNVYYGRGYVQITWDYNYKSIGKEIGLGDKLYINPDLALKENTAYKIMSYGMRHGSFTGKKLSDYIGSGIADYRNARRIINGTDHHIKIADYAESIEILLRLASRPMTGLRQKPKI